MMIHVPLSPQQVNTLRNIQNTIDAAMKAFEQCVGQYLEGGDLDGGDIVGFDDAGVWIETGEDDAPDG